MSTNFRSPTIDKLINNEPSKVGMYDHRARNPPEPTYPQMRLLFTGEKAPRNTSSVLFAASEMRTSAAFLIGGKKKNWLIEPYYVIFCLTLM